jgi:hypothetical protein
MAGWAVPSRGMLHGVIDMSAKNTKREYRDRPNEKKRDDSQQMQKTTEQK